LKTYRCPRLRAERREDDLFSRQRLVPGFDQEAFSRCVVGLIGAGGLNGEIGEGLVRKGVGRLWITDFDRVELSNLNRQFFTKKDLFKNKALRLSRNLAGMGFGGTQIRAVAMSFQDAVERGLVEKPHLAVCGVDNSVTRVDACRYGLTQEVPVVFTAVSRDADNGYVFVQEPGGPCFGCVFGNASEESDDEEPQECPRDPAVKDILKLVGGCSLYAIDTVLMARKRNWNFRHFFLAGFVNDQITTVKRKENCPFCGSHQGLAPEREACQGGQK